MSKKDKKLKKGNDWGTDVHLDIPEDEIWTYQVPGLAAPHVNKPYKYYNLKKAIFVIVIIVAVSLSMLFSVLALQNETFEYTETTDGIEFSKFSNTGYLYELDIDYVSEIEYIAGNNDPATNFKVVKDETKPITSVRQFTLNCDDKIKTIRIGANVTKVDPKAFYSCWALQNIEVDENNPNYCDVDGVLYNKDKTEILCYPCDHDEYLRQKYGYENELYRNDVTPEYQNDIQTYVVPSTVKKIGEMCFNYANLRVIYLPEGLETIETLAVFKLHERVDQWGTTPSLENVFTYKASDVTDPHFTGVEALGEVYLSLPEGLEFIGLDAFNYASGLTYLYIPSSIKEIGAYSFCYCAKTQAEGNKIGLTEVNVGLSAESFKKITAGEHWVPEFRNAKNEIAKINYGAERA